MSNILIICGGRSAEHEISIRSTKSIINALQGTNYNPVIVVMSRTGNWFYIDSSSTFEAITRCDDLLENGTPCTLIRKNSESYLMLDNGTLIPLAVAFPVLHGPMGEDGTMQGLLDIMSLPYVGSGVLASALGMDKVVQKQIFKEQGLPIAPFIAISKFQQIASYHDASQQLQSDILFVKPSVMGSSVGVFKVRDEQEYDIAVAEALQFCNTILVEKFIPCREIECAVLGNNNPSASPLGEIVPNHDFYSYEAKYLDPNGADLIAPVTNLGTLEDHIKKLAIQAFQALDCRGLARVDFFVNGDLIYLNEINTIPGFTSISMYPRLWQVAGKSYQELITDLIDLAFEEFSNRQKVKLEPGIAA